MKWISVKDRLPEQGVFVLAYRPDACFDKQKVTKLNRFRVAGAEWSFGGIEMVTHWMPLPEPPKPPVKTLNKPTSD